MGRIHGMKVREERVLTDWKLSENCGQTDLLLSVCRKETLGLGLYDFDDKDIFSQTLPAMELTEDRVQAIRDASSHQIEQWAQAFFDANSLQSILNLEG